MSLSTSLSRQSVALFLVVAATTSLTFGESRSGQVVCSACWFESDRNVVDYGTEADLQCAADCAEGGIPPALAVREGDGFTLYLLQGDPPGGERWLAWTSKFATVEGELGEEDGKPTLRATSIQTLAERPWETSAASTETGGSAELSWTGLNGKPFSLSRHPGRLVVINFWATWCKPCIEEMPDLVELNDRYAPYGVQFIGAAADDPGKVKQVLRFVRKHDVNFHIVLGATTAQMQSLGLAPVLPGTVVLDEHGHAVATVSGVVDPDELDDTLAQQLGLVGSSAGEKRRRSSKVAHVHRHGSSSTASLVPS